MTSKGIATSVDESLLRETLDALFGCAGSEVDWQKWRQRLRLPVEFQLFPAGRARGKPPQ